MVEKGDPEVLNMVEITRWIWRTRLPLKVRIFLWMALQGRILTKEYRAIWRSTMSTTCELCRVAPESIDHLFCLCPVLLPLWRTLGAATGRSLVFSNRMELWEQMRDFSGPTSARALAQVENLVIPATLWAIWLGRNKLLFARERFYVENIWDNVLFFISAWGCSLVGARRVRMVRGELQIEPG
ncbi:hypothetical protein QJS10_CPB18g01390 [Acorus calamus]|uniref:Reverse transcriptase zinc-binding domain-containing protein n=1 Tax=Acorus calamus TaxID=4465 RepID=A0AAV9CK56_ACOCL|nr:hypothetical protein QJS10_CPB18g01390 [Acorus calamus]